jgi:hypothetical protein
MKIILPYQLLLLGTGYTITITPTWSSAIYSEGYAVWIDYNRCLYGCRRVWSKAASTINPVSGSLRFPPQQL